MKIIKLVIATVMLTLPALSSHCKPWSLGRTINSALKSSNAILLKQIDADDAMIDALTANKSRLPSVSLSAGATVVSDVMELSMPGRTIRFGDYDSYNMMFQVRQILYDGGRLKALGEAGRIRSKMENHQAVASALMVEYTAKAAFFTLIMAEEAEKIAATSIIEAENHLKDVKALFAQGMALENNVVRAQLRISTAKMDAVSSTAELERARALFRNLLGLTPGEEITVVWDRETMPDVTKVASYHDALMQRPEFQAFDAAVTASDNTIEGFRAAGKPSLALFGAFNYGKPGLDLPQNQWMHYFSGGVQLNWSIWDWGKVDCDVEKANLSRRRILRSRNEFERNLAEEISKAQSESLEAVKRVKLALEATNFSKKNLDLTVSAYQEGMASETDYDNAHTAHSRSLLDLARAQTALHMSQALVDYVTGVHYTGAHNE
ncbi:TolC family protein [Candidatus Latescibacterota bacterium]